LSNFSPQRAFFYAFSDCFCGFFDEKNKRLPCARRKPGGQAFPEGKVDFLQLVAEKTKEGLPSNPEGKLPLTRELSP